MGVCGVATTPPKHLKTFVVLCGLPEQTVNYSTNTKFIAVVYNIVRAKEV